MVIESDVIRYIVCRLLLVFFSNFVPISLHLRYIRLVSIEITETLKPLKTQGHRKLYHSIQHQ